jgi:hypothetical protein
MRTLILAALGVALLAPSAIAFGERGDEMLWACKGEGPEPAIVGKLLCAVYLNGFLDSHSIAMGLGDSRKETNFCLPASGISNDQAVRVVVQWLEAHPADLHKSGRTLVLLALRDAFPCSR